MATVLSVNVGEVRPIDTKTGQSGIDKRPVEGAAWVRAPGPKGGGEGSGLVGDKIVDAAHHGGDDQAVYAYAREDLDDWQQSLGRALRCGAFGENLTTAGLDITGARIGERWRIGGRLLLQVTSPRIPCRTFAAFMGEGGWVKTFVARAAPGAYLRVVEPGEVRAGDPVAVERRPDHEITVGLAFRALTREADLLPRLLEADDLPEDAKELARRRTLFVIDLERLSPGPSESRGRAASVGRPNLLDNRLFKRQIGTFFVPMCRPTRFTRAGSPGRHTAARPGAPFCLPSAEELSQIRAIFALQRSDKGDIKRHTMALALAPPGEQVFVTGGRPLCRFGARPASKEEGHTQQ